MFPLYRPTWLYQLVIILELFHLIHISLVSFLKEHILTLHIKIICPQNAASDQGLRCLLTESSIKI